MASSIHTIHRPVARSKRAESSALLTGPFKPRMPTNHEEPEPDEIDSGSEASAEDFEEEVSGVPLTDEPIGAASALPPHVAEALRSHPPRQASMGTVKLRRRSRLAEKLKDVFELDDISEVWAGKCHSSLNFSATEHRCNRNAVLDPTLCP